MSHKIPTKKQAIKAFEKINGLYYSNIKEDNYELAENPRPKGYF